MPPCTCADFMRSSAAVRAACPQIDSIADDCAAKAEELRFEEDLPAALPVDELVALARDEMEGVMQALPMLERALEALPLATQHHDAQNALQRSEAPRPPPPPFSGNLDGLRAWAG